MADRPVAACRSWMAAARLGRDKEDSQSRAGRDRPGPRRPGDRLADPYPPQHERQHQFDD